MSQLSNSELACLRSVRRAGDELGIPVIAVGANARRIVFDSPNRIPIHRITTDWDFGVRVPNWAVFHQLCKKLIEQTDSFTPGPYEHRLIHNATGINIDLVPFGGLENEGEIQWPGSALKMNVFGFSDAHENAIELELAPDFRLPVATIPLLVALKFFAFSDRRQDSDRDLFDLWHIMRNYVSSGRESELFDEPLSSVAKDDFDWEYAPSLLLGYDIGRACKRATVKKLLPILNHFIDPYSGNIGKLIVRTFSQEQEEAERRRVSCSFLWLTKGLGIARSGS